MRNTLLQFGSTLFFTMMVLSASSQTSWSITGNSNTTSANFIGTKNSQPFILRTNNAERMRVAKTGQIGIGGLPEPDVILKTINTTQATAIFGFTAITSG